VLHTQGWTETLEKVEGELEIGKKIDVYAEVYAEESPYSNTYSIIKNEKYYIKVK
jgi:hypothetical protein